MDNPRNTERFADFIEASKLYSKSEHKYLHSFIELYDLENNEPVPEVFDTRFLSETDYYQFIDLEGQAVTVYSATDLNEALGINLPAVHLSKEMVMQDMEDVLAKQQKPDELTP